MTSRSNTEKDLEKTVLEALGYHPEVADVWPTDDKVTFNRIYKRKKGLPDICGYLKDGRFFCFELKRAKGSTKRDAQIAFIARAKSFGCIADFAKSLKDVLDTIRSECG